MVIDKQNIFEIHVKLNKSLSLGWFVFDSIDSSAFLVGIVISLSAIFFYWFFFYDGTVVKKRRRNKQKIKTKYCCDDVYRSSLMAGGAGASDSGAANPWLINEPEETRGLSFGEIKQQQQRIIEGNYTM